MLVPVVNIKDPRWNRHGTIDAMIEHPTEGWVEFTATPDDPMPGGRHLYEYLTDPKNVGEIAPYVKSQEEIEAEAQDARDQELAEIDKIATNAILWGELSEEDKTELAARRKTLVALSNQPGWSD